MSQILEQIAEIVQSLILQLGYPGIAAVMFIENVFPPIPSEVVMPFAGLLVGRGELNFVGVWLAGTLGSALGGLVLYYVGWWGGDTVIRGILRRYGKWLGIPESDYDRALKVFNRFGTPAVFFGRLIPIVRSLISLPAGADHMPLPRFLLFTTAGSAIWSGVLAYAGMVLGENWEEVIGFIDQYQTLTMIVLVILAVLIVGGWIYYKLRGRSNGVAVESAEPEV